MGVIRLQNVSKQFGGRVVLHEVSLELHTGQKVGVVGANGAGKTTLFRLITGGLAPDTGTVTLSRGLDFGYLPQEPEVAEGRTLHDEVLSALEEVLDLERKLQAVSDEMASTSPGPRLDELMQRYDRLRARFEAAGGYAYEQRLNEILGGLGFRPEDFELPMSALSGGQKCRAALAKLLLRESKYLLLDEPTNHLDLDAVRWLERFLAGHKGGAAIISHDRYLLDRLADRIVEIENGEVHSCPGNYTNYVHVRGIRQRTLERRYVQDKAFIEKERAFIAKHMGKQRTAEARGRLKRLERRLAAGEFVREAPKGTESLHLRFEESNAQVTRGKDVLVVQDLAKQYGDKRLFSGLSFRVTTGQRLGITGPNGTGKTTLLRILLGKVEPDAGRCELDPKASLGYYAQEAEDLDPDKTIVQEILSVRPDMLESQARAYAARFLFRGEEPFKRVAQLSGGEQSRVRLMKIILAQPNVLVLDEPTNHLDIAAREVLEAALQDFPGTIITVSHDRYFLDRICRRLLVLRPEGHALYEGNYSYYLEQIEQQETGEKRVEKRRPRKAPPCQPASPPKQRSKWSRLKLEELETLIMEHETRLMELHERFGEPELYHDPEAVEELRLEFERIQAELAEAEAEWNARAEREGT